MPGWNNTARKNVFDPFASGEELNRSSDSSWVFSPMHTVDDLSASLPIIPYRSPYSAAADWYALLSHALTSSGSDPAPSNPAQADYLDPQVLVFEDDALTFTQFASGTGGATSSASASSATSAYTSVTSSNSKLQFNLYWNSSMSAAPAGFKNAVINSAKYFTSLFTTYNGALEVININVGYGEVGGAALPANALGASASYGYLTNYATLTSRLGSQGGYKFLATNRPTSAQFFVTSAQAKTLGLINQTSTAKDGSIGFGTLMGTGYSWNTNSTTSATSTGTQANQYALQPVIQHELAEIMGRISMEGTVSYNRAATYTSQDLFDYSAPGVLSLSPSGGYFSLNNGSSSLAVFNNAAKYGGDIGDWLSAGAPPRGGTFDAFNAYAYPGYNGGITATDALAVAALGYKRTSLAVA